MEQRPTTDDRDAWSAYWKEQGQPWWRIEPEIDTARQEQLSQCRAIAPSIEDSIYPFKGIEPKLTRADVEWLLATHESGGITGPVDWNDESQRGRQGLDLRGADLRDENLRCLPLTRMHSGLSASLYATANEEQKNMAAVLLDGAKLNCAQLQEANLRGAQLKG